MLDVGIRADRSAAERLMAYKAVRLRSLAGWQQHVEALRMYGYSPASVHMDVLCCGLNSKLVPRLEFVALHACALDVQL